MSGAIRKSEHMQSLFRYIENNMPDDLDAELLTNIGYVSCAQLYRDFYSLTGHSVKEYIRRRRLSNALALIKTSDMGLTEIAFQCGYSSHQAMCRSVRRTIGLTPSEYKAGDTYYFFPPWSGEPLQSVTVSGETIPRAMRVLFYHTSLTDIENIAVGTFLRAFPDYGGRIFGRNGEQAGNKLCYELYLTDTENSESRDAELRVRGFEPGEIKPPVSATFASTAVQNNEEKIGAAWDYLYYSWLQSSMFEYTGEPYFEEYILRGGRAPSPLRAARLKLYLPIRKRIDDTKITLITDPDLRFIVSRAAGRDAEKTASGAVIDYLSGRYPHIVKHSKEFYIHKEPDLCVCGVRLDSRLPSPIDENIRCIETPGGAYLMLESGVMGDYDQYSAMLLSFAADNNMAADKKDVFAVYDAKESFDKPKIRMYCRVDLKIGTK